AWLRASFEPEPVIWCWSLSDVFLVERGHEFWTLAERGNRSLCEGARCCSLRAGFDLSRRR
ncbi:hypothetical protein A2U01_0094714, partial [Trifolium medium]|nr:hypothetical protein [Trifolium medium]